MNANELLREPVGSRKEIAVRLCMDKIKWIVNRERYLGWGGSGGNRQAFDATRVNGAVRHTTNLLAEGKTSVNQVANSQVQGGLVEVSPFLLRSLELEIR